MKNFTDLVPGLTLAQDILTPNGRLILPRGTLLTDRHIDYLKRWGIARVNITEKRGIHIEPGEVLGMLTEEIEGFLAPIFARNDLQHPLVSAVYRLGVERLRGKAMDGWKPPRKGASLPVSDHRFKDEFFAGDYSLKELIRHEVQLSSFPDIYFKISQAINSPLSNADYLARVISSDVSVCAKLLRMVNSPFFGMPSRVDSVSRAIALVGADELSTLAMGISAISAFKDIPENLVDMKAFWTHSLAVGIISRRLGEDMPEVAKEKIFVGGLLHDIGKLIIFKKLPEASKEVIINSQTNLLPAHQSEQEILGFDHARAGSLLAGAWSLPDFLRDQIKGHHDTGKMISREAAIIHLADFLAIGLVFAEKGSIILPALNPSSLKMVKLGPENLKDVLTDVEQEFKEISAIFFG